MKKSIMLVGMAGIVLYGTLHYYSNRDEMHRCPVAYNSETENVVMRGMPDQTETRPDAMVRFGKAKYASNFTHFDYANQDAPKGGTLRLGAVGSYDKINIFILKGRAAEGALLTRDTLMVNAQDEALTKYGCLAESVKVAPDHSSVTFALRKEARFHDGAPVTTADLKATIETLRDEGLPAYGNFYRRIAQIQIHDPYTLTFVFKPKDDDTYDPMMPTVMANATILSKKQLETLNFSDAVLTKLIATGPYTIGDFKPGKTITYKRNPDYWGKDLPVNKGRFNFDTIRIDYYKDEAALFEGFSKNLFDVFFDGDPQHFERIRLPKPFKKLAFKHRLPVSVKAVLLNMHNPIFKNRCVREALAMVFDFDRINRIYFGGQMQAARSLFENTGLGHQAQPTPMEKTILETQKALIGDDAFYNKMLTTGYTTFAMSKDKETVLSQAEALLEAAGYTYDQNLQVRSNPEGKRLVLKLITRNRHFEKLLNIFKVDLQKIGVQLHIQVIEESLYRQKEDQRDYDMMVYPWTNSRSPGIEQLGSFSRQTAYQTGSSNYLGLDDVVAENLAQRVAQAQSEMELQASVKALDRYIMCQHYFIPIGYRDSVDIVYRADKIAFTQNADAGIDVTSCGWTLGIMKRPKTNT